MSRRVLAFLATAAILGIGSGVLWWLIVPLPVYQLDAYGRASVSGRELTQFFAADAWFCLFGLLVGVLLGILGYQLLRDLGWPVVLLVVLGGLGAGLLCWATGYQLGPGDFTARLAATPPGGSTAIALTIRSKATLLLWPVCAVTPVLLASSLGRDADELHAPLSGQKPIRAMRDGS